MPLAASFSLHAISSPLSSLIDFAIFRFLHTPPACRDRQRFFNAAFIDDAIY
jgi:hypothetical protein